MSLCIAASGTLIALAATSFSLSWTHSVEKIAWVERWTVVEHGLRLDEASVQGSGAGIGLPDDAILRDGLWTYRPNLAPLNQLILAASGTTPSPWTLCTEQTCLQLGEVRGEAIKIWATEHCVLPTTSSGFRLGHF